MINNKYKNSVFTMLFSDLALLRDTRKKRPNRMKKNPSAVP